MQTVPSLVLGEAATIVNPVSAFGNLNHTGFLHWPPPITTTRARAKSTLFCQGDAVESLIEVIRGTVKIYRLMADGRRQITGFYLAGSVLGVAAKYRYEYCAETITEVTYRRYPRLSLDFAIDHDPLIGRMLFELAAAELAEAHRQMLLLGRKRPVEKVASFLLDWARRSGRVVEPGFELHLPMGRGDIADYLGLTIETVSRTISRLRKAGIVELQQTNRIALIDPKQLREWAEN